MPEGLTEVIQYISQREEELSRYSDKLRDAVTRIFWQFGDPNYCQICNHASQYPCENHTFKPKIHLSLDMDGDVFSTQEDQWENKIKYSIIAEDGQLKIQKADGHHRDVFGPEWAARKTLKQIIKTKAITQFLQEYQKELDKTTQEYGEVSSVAEKMASVLA